MRVLKLSALGAKKFASTLFVLSLSMVLTSCLGLRTGPVYNINNAPIVAPAGKKLSLKDIEAAIKVAGARLGWEMKTIKPGYIEATLRVRSHVAIVNITFNRTSYNINYKDSINLKYKAGRIHTNYNGWIENLDREIKAQLIAIAYNKK